MWGFAMRCYNFLLIQFNLFFIIKMKYLLFFILSSGGIYAQDANQNMVDTLVGTWSSEFKMFVDGVYTATHNDLYPNEKTIYTFEKCNLALLGWCSCTKVVTWERQTKKEREDEKQVLKYKVIDEGKTIVWKRSKKNTKYKLTKQKNGKICYYNKEKQNGIMYKYQTTLSKKKP
jgi:hypothetical protein